MTWLIVKTSEMIFLALDISAASMTSAASKTSTASMTSAASLTLKLPKMQALCILSGFLGLSHLDSLFLWD